MTDEYDRYARRERDVPLVQADPQENAPQDPAKLSSLRSVVTELNTQRQNLNELKAAITPQFVAAATREQLQAKEQEVKTIVDTYRSKFLELDRTFASTKIQGEIDAQKAGIDTNDKQIQEMISTSKFHIADKHARKLHELYEKLKDEKAKITTDYLNTASLEDLERHRSLHSDWYSDFVVTYGTVRSALANLTKEESDRVIDEKIWLETVSPNVDRFLEDEIKKRKNAPINANPPEPKPGPSSQSVDEPKSISEIVGGSKNGGSEPLVGEHHIQVLQKKLDELQTKHREEKQAADDRISSLEVKFSSRPLYDETADSEPAESAEIESAEPSVKIGNVDVPIFNGSLEDWEAFRDLFEFLVHKNKKLSKVVKFTQLRTHLKGVALETIKGYQVTGKNYDSAWADLNERFNRTEELVDEYIRKFFEVKAIDHKANFATVRSIVDATNQMLRALPNLGVEVDEWDPIISLIIRCKLNDELRSEWTQKKRRENLNQISDLLDHLETKAIELQPSQGDKLSHMLKGESHKKPQKRVVFQVNERDEKKTEEKKPEGKKCLVCKGNHFIWNCFKLKNECAKVRTDIIKSLKLCFKCLLKHQVGLCEESECEYCKGPHHVLLCYKKENDEKRRLGSFHTRTTKSNRQPKPSTSYPSNPQDDWDDDDKPSKN